MLLIAGPGSVIRAIALALQRSEAPEVVVRAAGGATVAADYRELSGMAASSGGARRGGCCGASGIVVPGQGVLEPPWAIRHHWTLPAGSQYRQTSPTSERRVHGTRKQEARAGHALPLDRLHSPVSVCIWRA